MLPPSLRSNLRAAPSRGACLPGRRRRTSPTGAAHFVEPSRIRHAASHDDDVRVEDVDDTREAAGQAALVPLDCRPARVIARIASFDDGLRRETDAGKSLMVPGQGRTREKGFDAAMLAAVTWGPGKLNVEGPW